MITVVANCGHASLSDVLFAPLDFYFLRSNLYKTVQICSMWKRREAKQRRIGLQDC